MMTGAASLLLLSGCSDDGENDAADEGDEEEGTTAPPDTQPIGIDSCADVPESSAGALNQGAVVNMIEFEFCQPEVTVETGQTVRWVNNGSTRHQVVHAPPGEQERLFEAPGAMLAGDVYDFTFTEAGSYPYVCTFHDETMVGTINVS
jgi:plastocyanin